jgi:hypothetical protein
MEKSVLTSSHVIWRESLDWNSCVVHPHFGPSGGVLTISC